MAMDTAKHKLRQLHVRLQPLLDAMNSQQPVFRAASLGIGLFFTGYLILFLMGVHLFVFWKWDIAESFKAVPSKFDATSLDRLSEDPDASIRILDQRMADIQGRLIRHQDTYKKASELLVSLKSMDKWTVPQMPKIMMMSNITSQSTDLAQTKYFYPFLDALPDGLENAFLTPSKLKQEIYSATNELLDLTKTDSNVRWEEVVLFFKSHQWKSIDWSYFDGSRYCSQEEEALEDQAFVDELIDAAREAIHEREEEESSNDWKVAWMETKEEIDEFYSKQLSIAQSRLKYLGDTLKRKTKKTGDAATIVSTSAVECPLDRERVMALVEGGLDALYRRKDLREAVGGMTAEESVVIMDTRVDEPWKPASPPFPETVNLRRIIDKPLLKQVALWIDNALDLMGGYSDFVDSRIDSLTQGRDDFGSILIDYLLQLSGRVDVPVPLRIQTRKLAEQTS